jgi:broad specificity phosphatase PhoE
MTAPPTRIHLIRHGEVYNPDRLLYGRLPGFGLSTDGRRQARAAGLLLNGSPLDGLYCSPLLRARQTGREILRSVNQTRLHISTLINEVCTAYEGHPGAEVDALGGDVYTGAAACFEQPADVVARTRRFIERLRRRHPGGRVAAVTHGDIITFMVLWAKGAALTPENKNRLARSGFPAAYPAHASITTLTYLTGDPAERPRIDYVRP